jgi:hypothetical protein
MSAIATFRIAVAALLYDTTNVIFTSTEIDEALRWALFEYSFKRPLIRTYDFTVVSSTKIHNLPADFITRHVIKVELWDSDPDAIYELAFYAYMTDEQWVIQTTDEVGTNEVLQISYSTVHQIDGLDSASGTTIPLVDEMILEIGAAGHAAQMRAMGTVESINMNSNVAATYRNLAIDYLARFNAGIIAQPGIAVASMDYPDTSMLF